MSTTSTSYDLVAERWPIIATALLTLALVTAYPYAVHAIRIAQIPVVGTELGGVDKRRQAYISSARKLYNDGYRKVRTWHSLQLLGQYSKSDTTTVQKWNLPDHDAAQ